MSSAVVDPEVLEGGFQIGVIAHEVCENYGPHPLLVQRKKASYDILAVTVTVEI